MKSFTYNIAELETKVSESLGLIKAETEKNHYVLKNPENFDKLLKYNFKSHIEGLSKRSLKRLNRYLFRLAGKMNRGNMNRFLHFVTTRVISKKIEYTPEWAKGYYDNYIQIKYEYPLESIKILPSLKEQEIQKKRKEWKELKDQAEKALFDYKKEKGDFYKNPNWFKNNQFIPSKKEEKEEDSSVIYNNNVKPKRSYTILGKIKKIVERV